MLREPSRVCLLQSRFQRPKKPARPSTRHTGYLIRLSGAVRMPSCQLAERSPLRSKVRNRGEIRHSSTPNTMRISKQQDP